MDHESGLLGAVDSSSIRLLSFRCGRLRAWVRRYGVVPLQYRAICLFTVAAVPVKGEWIRNEKRKSLGDC